VTDAQDASLHEALALLADAGAAVEIAPDVYTAMARLARNGGFSRVLVDVRGLDDAEMSFIRLAGQYFPGIQVAVPVLAGTAARLSGAHNSVRAVPMVAIAASLQDEPAAVRSVPAHTEEPSATQQRGETERTPQPPQGAATPTERRPLSTDGGPEAAGEGPPLYEAVRMRMSEGTTAPVRRIPPPMNSGAVRPGEALDRTSDGTLTPAELEALLDVDPFREPTTRRRPGGGSA
jgi:hypothetical protein